MTIPNQTVNDQIDHLPGHILFDIARNESQAHDWRKAALEVMLDKNYPQANHPDLAHLLFEIQAQRAARKEVESVVESAIEGEIPVVTKDKPVAKSTAEPPKPLAASFTTNSILANDQVNN